MKQIIIESQNPNDIQKDDLFDVAEKINKETEIVVTFGSREQVGYGVTWYEVLHVWLPDAGKVLLGTVLKELIFWARDRMKKKSKTRPKSINIYGPNGEVLKSVVIKNQDDNVEDKTEEPKSIQEKYARKPPERFEPFE
jgi:hypothetical protein